MLAKYCVVDLIQTRSTPFLSLEASFGGMVGARRPLTLQNPHTGGAVTRLQSQSFSGGLVDGDRRVPEACGPASLVFAGHSKPGGGQGADFPGRPLIPTCAL